MSNSRGQDTHTDRLRGSHRRPRAIDLFCGAGGLTQGLKQAGFVVIGALDSDPVAVETYRLNHPRTRVVQDNIENISTSSFMNLLRLAPGELDLLAGCPPCQGFSSMRTHNGSVRVRDVRNDLLFEFLRFVRLLMPKAVMMENVPGLDADPCIDVFCAELDNLGYKWKRDVLNTQYYGVPQRRRRLLLLAGRFGNVPFAIQEDRRYTVRETIWHLPTAGSSGDILHDLPEKRAPRIMELIKSIPLDGGSRCDLGDERQLACHKRTDGFHDVYGRMAWDDVAPTITSGSFNPSKGRFLHPEQDRTITQREAALLQTFPPHYQFSLRRGKTYVATLIGNALPPRFVECHALEVRKYLAAAPGE